MLSYEGDLTSREDSRRLLRESADYRWVTADEWQKLIVGHASLVRADHNKAGVRGLLDPQSGSRFVIEEELLK